MLRLCVAHPAHAGFIVDKLWDYFVAGPLPRPTRRSLAATYRRSGHRIKTVVADILAHPTLYRNLDRPSMVKSPVVFVAGALRSAGQGVERDAWGWLLSGMGQTPFSPPSVAGWDWGTAWLSSNSMHLRFDAANYLLDTPRVRVEDESTPAGLSPGKAVALARRAVGDPWTSRQTDASCCASPAGCSTTARRGATEAGASPSSSEPTCASACCASCSSADPTPRCTDEPPPRM